MKHTHEAATCCEVTYKGKIGLVDYPLSARSAYMEGLADMPNGWYYVVGQGIYNQIKYCFECGKALNFIPEKSRTAT